MKKFAILAILFTLFSCGSTKQQTVENSNKYKEYFSSLREQDSNTEVLTDVNSYSSNSNHQDWGNYTDNTTINIYANNGWCNRYWLGNVYDGYYGFYGSPYWSYSWPYTYYYGYRPYSWSYWNHWNYPYNYGYYPYYYTYYQPHYNGIRYNTPRSYVAPGRRDNIRNTGVRSYTPRTYTTPRTRTETPRVVPNNTRDNTPRVIQPRNTRDNTPRITPRNQTTPRVYNQGTRTQSNNSVRSYTPNNTRPNSTNTNSGNIRGGRR